jgi:hypothetical protein
MKAHFSDYRQKASSEEITEILLSKGKVISALKYANAEGLARLIPARKFLLAAKETGDPEVVHVTRNWLQEQKLLSPAQKSHDFNNL